MHAAWQGDMEGSPHPVCDGLAALLAAPLRGGSHEDANACHWPYGVGAAELWLMEGMVEAEALPVPGLHKPLSGACAEDWCPVLSPAPLQHFPATLGQLHPPGLALLV